MSISAAPLFFCSGDISPSGKSRQAHQGLPVPGRPEREHQFSAFVDDSTVFMQEARQLPRVLTIVELFGRLSGLHVQSAKSKVIFLNTAITQLVYHGIQVLEHGDTIRYLGYEVGTGKLTDVNWAVRIQNIRS